VRLVNKDDGHEIVRFPLDDNTLGPDNNAVYAGVLIREGPKWIFEAIGKSNNGGLAMVAKTYGLIIRELQSTGITGTDAEQRKANEKKDFS
jgi:hypothetical protein